MAKRTRKQSVGGNTADPELVRDVSARLREIEDEIASKKGEFMAFCKGKASERKDIFTEAKARGINTRALKVELKAAKLEGKAAELRDELEPDDQHDAEAIRKALGEFADTPLGNAATAKAEQTAADRAALDAMAGD